MTPLDPIYEIFAKEVINGFDKPEFSPVVNAFLTFSGYKIDHFATKTNDYNDLKGAITCLISMSNIKGLTAGEFITQEGFSFD